MATKKCTYCKKDKPLSEYYPIKNGLNGVRPRCKECMNALERAKYSTDDQFRKAKLKSQANWLKSPENLKLQRQRTRRWHLKVNYGLTMEAFDEMVRNQGGGCAICGRSPIEDVPKSRLVVDHCHRTKKIRGVLCDLCNTALGKMQDSPEILEKAANYLRSYEEPEILDDVLGF